MTPTRKAKASRHAAKKALKARSRAAKTRSRRAAKAKAPRGPDDDFTIE
jgi:hypothetical protein